MFRESRQVQKAEYFADGTLEQEKKEVPSSRSIVCTWPFLVSAILLYKANRLDHSHGRCISGPDT